MPTSISQTLDADQTRAARRARTRLPAAPWVELLGFLLLITLTVLQAG